MGNPEEIKLMSSGKQSSLRISLIVVLMTLSSLILVYAIAKIFQPIQEAQNDSRTPQKRASIAFRPAVVDFGTVLQGDPVRKMLLLRNESTNAVRVVGVTSSCACTTVPEGLLGVEVQPSGELEVPIILDTLAKTGPAEALLILKVQDQRGVQYQIGGRLHGEIIPDFVIEPSVITFGSVAPGVRTERSVRFVPRSLEELEVVFEDTVEEPLSVTTRRTTTHTEAIIAIEAPKSQNRTELYRELRFKTTSTRVPQVTINVNASIVPEIEVHPAVIFVKKDQNQMNSIAVQVRTRTPSRIQDLFVINDDSRTNSIKEILSGLNNKEQTQLEHRVLIPLASLLGARALNVRLAFPSQNGVKEADAIPITIKRL